MISKIIKKKISHRFLFSCYRSNFWR